MIRILQGDCRAVLKTLPDKSVHMVVTSPPYFGLRDYGVAGQIGMEAGPQAFVDVIVDVMREARRVLRDDGTLWLNLGDSYANDGKWGVATGGIAAKGLHGHTSVGRRKKTTGLKPKDMMGIPWRVAFALQDDGWFLRQDIIWAKPNPMPESVDDRCTKAHEYLFLLSKSEHYYFDAEAIAENRTSDEDADTFRGGSYVRDDGGSARKVSGNRRRGLPPRHTEFLDSSDQSGLDEVGRGGRRNKRSVWTVATRAFSGEFCRHCQTFFDGARLKALKVTKTETPASSGAGVGARAIERIRHCECGRTDGWVAHFATFPPELIEPCILAGTSEKGACSSCGAPWEREIEKITTFEGGSGRAGRSAEDLNAAGKWQGEAHRQTAGRGSANKNLKRGPVVDVITKRWVPTCDCPTIETEACVVLDLFGGAGTTALVADRLKRDALLIELNSDYAEMARQRVRGEAPLLAEVE